MAYLETLKPVRWRGASHAAMRELPGDARFEAGHELNRLQQGLDPVNWKPMSTIGPGVAEIRVYAGREYRVFYLARFAEAVYVLHVFEKKSRKTSGLDLELGRVRYRQLVRERSGQ